MGQWKLMHEKSDSKLDMLLDMLEQLKRRLCWEEKNANLHKFSEIISYEKIVIYANSYGIFKQNDFI